MPNVNETAPATSSAQNLPRPPNAEELRQLADWLQSQGYDRESAASIAECGYAAVYDRYSTGGPGYVGKVMSVVWDGAPSFFDVFTWERGKMERSGRDSDEKECDRCGAKNASLCVNCWRDYSRQLKERTGPSATPSARTKPPWHVERKGIETFITNEQGWRIAEIVHAQTFVPDNQEEQDAALLIAAAPELLRELEVAVKFLARIPPDAIEAVENELNQALSLPDMKSLIDKAHGQAT